MLILFSFISIASYAAEDSIYDFEWMDQDKEIYVLQNRLYQKQSKFQFTLLGSKTMSDKFIDGYSGILKAAFYLNEDWGIELLGGLGFGSENPTAGMIREQGTVPFYRKLETFFGANIIWSPFYGKFNAFNQIYYLDWFISAGLVSVSSSDNRKEFDTIPDRSKTTESSLGLDWSTGLLFYLSQSWMIRFEFQGLHFQGSRYGQASNGTGDYNKKQFFHFYAVSIGPALMF